MKREEQKIENTWKMEDMYSSDQAMEDDLNKALEMLKEYDNYKDKVSKDKETLLKYLKFNDEINLIAERVYVYSNQKYHEDMANSKYQTYSGKAQKLVVDLGSATAFFEPEILEMDENVLKEWLENKEFADYRRYISEILRAKAHTLDKKTEEILAKSKRMASAADNIYAMYNGADIDFPTVKDKDGNEIKITHGNFVPILSGADRQLRKDAFKALYGTYGKMKNTIAATYNANVEQACFYADVRNYPSTRAMYLDESNIPEEVYDNLIEVVHEHMDLMHRYVSLRKKALGVDQLHMYDVYAPIVETPDKKIPFEKAKEMVKAGLAPMGKDYINKLQEGFDNRWIDIYENDVGSACREIDFVQDIRLAENEKSNLQLKLDNLLDEIKSIKSIKYNIIDLIKGSKKKNLVILNAKQKDIKALKEKIETKEKELDDANLSYDQWIDEMNEGKKKAAEIEANLKYPFKDFTLNPNTEDAIYLNGEYALKVSLDRLVNEKNSYIQKLRELNLMKGYVSSKILILKNEKEEIYEKTI